MVPRPQVKAIEMKSSIQQILDIILSAEFSRFPVYKGRLDNIEGLIHVKDVIPILLIMNNLT
jgi:putative hemolysin